MPEDRDRFYLPRTPVPAEAYPPESMAGSYAKALNMSGRTTPHEAELAERVRCALVILSTCGTYDGRTKDALIDILEGATPITRKL